MSETVRVGIAGAGGIAQVSHLPAYARIPEARVTTVCDADLGRARRVASRFNIPRVTDSIEELAALDDLDAIDICLPNHLHAPATVAALRGGKHVLCEKPFSRSSEEAKSMVTLAKRKRLILMSGMNHRFRDDVNVLRRFIAEGELGAPIHAKASWLMKPSTWAGASWKKERRYAGGGVLLDLGLPLLDLTLWILGSPRVDSVSASMHPLGHGESVENTATAMLRLKGGGTLFLEVSWALPTDRDVGAVHVFGEEGAAQLNPLRLHKEMHGSLVNVTPEVTPPGNAYKRSYENEIRHFIACVRAGETPLSPGAETLSILRVLDAMYESAREEREVAVA